MAFQTGLQALQQAIDDGKRAGGNFSGGSLAYFNWKDGDKKIVRFLSDMDDIITENCHEYVLCADGKSRSFLVNPDAGDLVAKYANPATNLGYRQDYKTKAYGPSKPRKTGFALAVLRAEVPKPGGKGVTYEDHFEDIEIKGEKFRSRTFGIIQQPLTNSFWSVIAGYANRNGGTLLDRDYEIIRKGKGLDTEYMIYACDPIDELRDPAAVKGFYGYGKPWNAEDPERYLDCPQTLVEWADYFSGEERVKHWLLPAEAAVTTNAGPPPDFYKADSDSADEAQATPQPSDSTDFSALREKLLTHKK